MTESPIADDGLQTLRKVWAILSATERRQLLLLVPAVILVAILETLGVASIVPFLGLLSDPSIIERNAALSWFYGYGGFSSRNEFFFAVGIGVLLLFSVGNAMSALTSWGLLRFSWMRSHTLASRLLEVYLRQPYVFFLEKNSAELGKNILSEVGSVVTGVIIQGLQLSARLVVVCGIVIALFIIDPTMAAGVLLVFGGVYGGLFLLIRRRVAVSGRERVALNQSRHKSAQDCIAGVKELKLYALEPVALEQFSGASHSFAERQAANAVLAQIPRYALETIAFGGVLVMTLYLLRAGRRLEDVLPVLGLYAFAAYRLLPALQTVFAGLTSMRFNLGALDILYRDMKQREATRLACEDVETVPFVQSLSLVGVSFRYRSATRATLEHVSVAVEVGSWVALVGATGAGKSTLVDVLLGLLEPDSGVVSVDGLALDRPALRLGWQRQVAYVPQQIFLVDDSVLRNIAFGLPDSQVDFERAVAAAKIAQIHDFIVGELSQGYDTQIGDRGIRLSGGQRQRIGIARALYRQPRFLVLDEATSALDNATEDAFFAALHRVQGSTTVVSIAHRLSTTRGFDRILVMERGRIVDEGTYDELEQRNAYFRIGREAA